VKKPIGICTALVTPYTSDGIDYDTLHSLIEYQIASGIDGLLICGSTAESALLTHEEKWQLIKFCISVINKRVYTVVGCGEISTSNTVINCQMATDLGADMLLVVTPYYVKTSEKGIINHYSQVAKHCNAPILAYNVPSRTGYNMNTNTIASLARLGNVIGIKQSNGSMQENADLIPLMQNGFSLVCGEDSLALPYASIGAVGLISVVSNAYPRIVKLAFAKDIVAYHNLTQLCKLVFCQPNPIPIKYIMYRLGMLKEYYLKLPLVAISRKWKDNIDKELPKYDCYL